MSGSGKYWMPTPIPTDAELTMNALSAAATACHFVWLVPVASSIEVDWSIMMYMSSGVTVALWEVDAHTHFESTHLACPHVRSHLPQCCGSDDVSTLQPSFGSPLQLALPGSHVTRHMPSLQEPASPQGCFTIAPS